MELRFTDDHNNTFVVNSENYEMYKIADGSKKIVSQEERDYVFKEIDKMQSLNLNKPKTYQEYLNLLKELISKGKIDNYNDLDYFVKNCVLTEEEKEKLRSYGLGELQLQNVVYLKERIIDSLNKEKNPQLKAMINFSVKDNAVGAKYCEVSLNYSDDVNIYTHIKEQLIYNENLEKELIEPVMMEVVKRSKITMHYNEKINDPINERGNFRLGTEEKVYMGVNNVSLEYAAFLNQKCENLDQEKDRQEDIPLYNDNIITSDGMVYDANGEYLGYINEMGEIVRNQDVGNSLELDKGRGRVLTKKGFSNVYVIFALTSLISSLIFILEIILFKK